MRSVSNNIILSVQLVLPTFLLICWTVLLISQSRFPKYERIKKVETPKIIQYTVVEQHYIHISY